MKSNGWFRMYSEFAFDPRVQTMSFENQRHLIMLFCLKCAGHLENTCDAEVTHALSLVTKDVTDIKSLFVTKGFIDEGWNLKNWRKRQEYELTPGAERTRRYRERLKLKSINGVDRDSDGHEMSQSVTVTVSDQIRSDIKRKTPSESKEKRTAPPPASALTTPKKSLKATRLSLEVLPDEWAKWAEAEFSWKPAGTRIVFAKFRDYWIAKSGAQATKLNWLATWRNWCRNEHERGAANGAVNGEGRTRREQMLFEKLMED